MVNFYQKTIKKIKTDSITVNKKWDEKRIKAVLIDYLIKKNKKENINHIICSETPFLGGKRWADILEIRKDSLIAYEIKSDLDSFIKLKKQLPDYMNTFNEVYVVLSKKFKGKHKDLPKSIGYFWIDPNQGKIVLKRKSKKKINISKKKIIHFLWKRDIPTHFHRYKESIDIIRKRVIKYNTVKYIHSLVIKALKKRYTDRFHLFLEEKKESKTHFSAINILTKKETDICYY